MTPRLASLWRDNQMGEANGQNVQQGARRYDPDLLKKGLRCDLEQYDMLKRCSDEQDMTEWNQWRKAFPTQDVELDIAPLSGRWLQGVSFATEALPPHQLPQEPEKKVSSVALCSVQLQCAHCERSNFELAHLEMASAHRAHLEGAYLHYAYLNNACFAESHLQGTCLDGSHLQGANFERAIVDGGTSLWRCEVDRETNFEGVPLDNVRIDPATKQLLEYNIRRKNWEQWYKFKDWSHWRGTSEQRRGVSKLLSYFVRLFWEISDYGRSTCRIICTFAILALFFAAIYSSWSYLAPPGIVSNLAVEPHTPLWHYFLLLLLRPVYFSVVTMTTLGFGDIYANARSIWGHILLTFQVILGYVLLGALVTRFAVLFTAGGPAGRFADEKTSRERIAAWWKRPKQSDQDSEQE